MPQVSLEKRSYETGPNQPRRQVAVRSYADPRLRELQRSKSEEELIQSVYRIRPLSVENYYGQGIFGFFEDGGPRKRATVHLFSSLPLPGLTVQLVEKKRPPATVHDLHQAAATIAERGERITEEKLAKEGSTSRYQARRFKTEEPCRSSLGALGPPPAHGPPLAAAR